MTIVRRSMTSSSLAPWRPRALWETFIGSLARPLIERRVALAVRALDDAHDALLHGPQALDRDRRAPDRDEALRDALEAWRVNPLARRIVSLTTQYVVGAGLALACPHPPTHAFLQAWWGHRLNRLEVRVSEWCDELTRSGNLIVLVSTDAAGMSYVRGLPASQVQEIVTRPNDVEQAVRVIEKPRWGLEVGGQKSEVGQGHGLPTSDFRHPTSDLRHWPIYDPAADAPDANGAWPTVALHYAINRPVGAAWGESDLAPLLRWLARYANWLEDRARLNRHRQSFVYVVRGLFKSAAERLARQAELNARPPTPGSILVTDANTEAWGVLHPQLDSFEAGEDGLALKKMIAAGSGNPLHFLAEPESATRTTAEAAGGPTFRHYEQRQRYFMWLLRDVAQVVVARRAQVDWRVRLGHETNDEGRGTKLAATGSLGSQATPALAAITASGADISARDNAELAQATAAIAAAFAGVRDRGLIDDAEYLRMVYRFAGEPVDIAALLERASATKDEGRTTMVRGT